MILTAVSCLRQIGSSEDDFLILFALLQYSAGLFLFFSKLGHLHAVFQLPILAVFTVWLKSLRSFQLCGLLIVLLLGSNFFPKKQVFLDNLLLNSTHLTSLYNSFKSEPWNWSSVNLQLKRSELQQAIGMLDYKLADQVNVFASNLHPYSSFALYSQEWFGYHLHEFRIGAGQDAESLGNWYELEPAQELKDSIVSALGTERIGLVYLPKTSEWNSKRELLKYAESRGNRRVNLSKAIDYLLKEQEGEKRTWLPIAINQFIIQEFTNRPHLKYYYRSIPLTGGTLWVHNSLMATSRDRKWLESFVKYYPNYDSDTVDRLEKSLERTSFPFKLRDLKALFAMSLTLIKNERTSDAFKILGWILNKEPERGSSSYGKLLPHLKDSLESTDHEELHSLLEESDTMDFANITMFREWLFAKLKKNLADHLLLQVKPGRSPKIIARLLEELQLIENSPPEDELAVLSKAVLNSSTHFQEAVELLKTFDPRNATCWRVLQRRDQSLWMSADR